MAETIMTSRVPQEKVGTVPSGKTIQGQIDALNSKIIQTTRKTISFSNGRGNIAQSEIPGTMIGVTGTAGWSCSGGISGTNYGICCFNINNGAWEFANGNTVVDIHYLPS